jgi:cytochrome c biogenesis protein CcdA
MAGSEDIFGGAVVLLGVILFFWRNKRKFDRTNPAGIEQFSSYGGKLAARLWDSIIWVSAFMSLTGGVLFLANVHESTWGWIVLLPCYALLLFGPPLGRPK